MSKYYFHSEIARLYKIYSMARNTKEPSGKVNGAVVTAIIEDYLVETELNLQ